jgi:hypothetical protein
MKPARKGRLTTVNARLYDAATLNETGAQERRRSRSETG